MVQKHLVNPYNFYSFFTMLNRKQLPALAKINKKIDLQLLREYIINNHYDDYNKYNDIKYSANSNHQAFLIANEYCKESFFKESDAPLLEGEKYKQLYLTNIDPSLITTDSTKLSETHKNIFTRTKRLDRTHTLYVPEADELNYGLRNEHCVGIFDDILNMFTSKVTRVRLAVLSDHFEIKPHVDYDPSYITRYHIPIFNNDEVIYGFRVNKVDQEYQMIEDGSVYFFNSGHVHWVKNLGDKPRLNLIIDTHGQEDLVFQ
jgi:hypothetical protein